MVFNSSLSEPGEKVKLLYLLHGFQQQLVRAWGESSAILFLVWFSAVVCQSLRRTLRYCICICCVVFSSGLSEPEEKEKKYEEKGVAEEDGLRNILNSDDEDEEEEENKDEEDNEDEEKKDEEKATKEKSENFLFFVVFFGKEFETMFLFFCALFV